MPPIAVALVVAAAVFHVAWNALVKTSGDPVETSSRAVALGAAVLAPIAAIAWIAGGGVALEPAGWGIGALSGLVEIAYFLQLSAAYRDGAMSSVYPVARGTGAVLAAAIGVVILGERLAPVEVAGVVLLLGGVAAAALPGARPTTLVAAFLTGCAIAGYSALDRVGVRTGSAVVYAAVIWTVAGLGLLLVAAVRRRRSPDLIGDAGGGALAGARGTPSLRRALVTGVLMVATYLLVLLALQIAPLAAVAPLRESATVLAAVWGVLVLGEREHAGWRIGGAAAVAVGAILLAIGG